MRLVIEPGDFPAGSGKQIAELADPMYTFRATITKAPDGHGTWGMISHRGSGYRVEAPQLKVEIEGVGVLGEPNPASAEAEDKGPKSSAARNKKGQFVRKEPGLTGPRLPDASDWLGG